jgi:hypothetical protein
MFHYADLFSIVVVSHARDAWYFHHYDLEATESIVALRRGKPFMPDLETGPIFIFSSGQRTGSTLLQRFLCSHPDILIWGEHDGTLAPVLAGLDRFVQWDEMFGKQQRETFLAQGVNNFIPNMTPPRERIVQAQEQLIRNLWQAPALELGKSIWGFKEVLYGADVATSLHLLFPTARVIYLTRNIFEVFISLVHEERVPAKMQPHVPTAQLWTRERTLECVDTWIRVNNSFLNSSLLHEDWVYWVKYEDLVEDREAANRALIGWLGFNFDDFDHSVYNHKLYTDRHNGPDRRPKITRTDLSPEEVALLTTHEILSISGSLQYDMSVSYNGVNHRSTIQSEK